MKLGSICAIAGVLLTAISPAAGQAQGRSCDDGRGAVMTDLGFDLPGRTLVDGEPSFGTQPRIEDVRSSGPAAGRLREGDLLLAVDGIAITEPAGARRYTRARPGDRLRLTVQRDDRVVDLTVVALGRCVPHPPAPPHPDGAVPAPDAPPAPVPPAPAHDELMPEGWLGLSIECLDCGEDESTGVFRFHQPPVVVRVEPCSPAAHAGLLPGDRLTHLNGMSLTDAAGWARFYAIQPGELVRFRYDRGGTTHEVSLTALHAPSPTS